MEDLSVDMVVITEEELKKGIIWLRGVLLFVNKLDGIVGNITNKIADATFAILFAIFYKSKY